MVPMGVPPSDHQPLSTPASIEPVTETYRNEGVLKPHWKQIWPLNAHQSIVLKGRSSANSQVAQVLVETADHRSLHRLCAWQRPRTGQCQICSYQTNVRASVCQASRVFPFRTYVYHSLSFYKILLPCVASRCSSSPTPRFAESCASNQPQKMH